MTLTAGRTFTWTDSADHSATVLAWPDGRTVATYHWSPQCRHAYFHPLHAYNAAGPLTLSAPFDHRWHRGLWWSWKYINGVNFWEDDMPPGEPAGESVVLEHAAKQSEEGIMIAQRLALRDVRTKQTLLRERRVLTLRPQVASVPAAWSIDFDLTWTASQDCTLSATEFPESPWGGYAGLNYRPARSMAWGETICNSEQFVGTAACHGVRTRWCAYGGNVHGDPTATANRPATATVAILDHPQNAGHPGPFYAWGVGPNMDGFGFLAAAPLMHGPLRIASGDALRLRYRVLILNGPADPLALETPWHEFAVDTL